MSGQSLSLDMINELLSSSKTRGDYEQELRNFISSDEVGIEVDLTSGTLTGKDPKNVATGFNNARKKMNADTGQPSVAGGMFVKVLLRWVDLGTPAINADGTPVVNDKGVPQNEKEGHVFLINTSKVGATTHAGSEVVEEDDES